jgi:hypothetical protein
MAGVGTCVVTSFGQCGVSVRVSRVLAPGMHAVILTCTFDDGCLRLVDSGNGFDVGTCCGIAKVS